MQPVQASKPLEPADWKSRFPYLIQELEGMCLLSSAPLMGDSEYVYLEHCTLRNISAAKVLVDLNLCTRTRLCMHLLDLLQLCSLHWSMTCHPKELSSCYNN
jgi:hypothetical protein